MNHNFKGTGVALVTPFHRDGTIDFDGLTKLVKLQMTGGTDFLVVQGTTGESPVLDQEEKMQVLNHVIEVNQGKLPVVYGLGGNNTADVCKKIGLLPNGVDGLLSVSPYYNKPLQAGIIAHYKMIASQTKLPIILYNVPGRTSSNVSAATTLELANIPNIVAMKEASGDLDQIMEILKNKPKDFTVLSGDDAITMPLISMGVEGVISVVANALPERFSQMVNSTLNHEMSRAKEEHFKLFDMIRLLFAEGNPGGIKEALVYREICENHMRLPLVIVSEGLKNEIFTEMKSLMP
ncbi:MAG: 4-hydroxy-tetrahydrodipicolinate synthase [Crocinitomicaceae bacterium]|jgi:4-hydroxy-tetrahydrodipicolinate synthase|tara:strand:+ start:49827 stop:50705 length:879 start_codon:yes stop_codon:yes gene_type:complete